jgi:antitoxin component YwqK of YwqJK toxin-antitoxin module
MLLCILFVACTNKQKFVAPEIKIAKTVPLNFMDSSDEHFSFHQDTLYYNHNYFTGFQFSVYNNGDTAFVYGYFNGMLEGIQKKWYENNQLAEERFYINGKKEGTHKGWWQDGKPKFIFDASNNDYEGEFKEWYASGVMAKKFHYIKGQEEGSQRLWWDNGTVRANYVIRNGKKYGLIGLKICINPYDSINKK